MNKLNVLLTTMLTILLLAGPSFARETIQEGKAPAMAESSMFTKDQLVGLAVVDRNGANVGEIKDVSLNARTGRINFVTLAEGGMLGIGEKRFAVPLEALDIRKDEKMATLIVSADKLKSAPSKAAGVSDEEFSGLIHQYYGVAPAWGDNNRSEPEGTMMKKEGGTPDRNVHP